MKIIITGGCGFIGSNLGNKLANLEHDVTVVDNFSNASDNEFNFKVVRSDYKNFNSYTKELCDADAVFHLAASINVDESISEPRQYLENNAFGTLTLLEFLKEQNPKARFIYASSAEVYGSARLPRMGEDHPIDPLSPYAISKFSAEQFCKVYAQIFGMNITVIRNFNTFGPHQRGGMYGGVIAKFANLAKQGLDLPVYGSGEQMRDYMYITQAVDGYALCLSVNFPTIVNFGSGKTFRIIDIANHIAKKFGVRVHHTVPRPNEIMRLEADISRATEYGYQARTDFWENLNEYLEWIRDSKIPNQ